MEEYRLMRTKANGKTMKELLAENAKLEKENAELRAEVASLRESNDELRANLSCFTPGA